MPDPTTFTAALKSDPLDRVDCEVGDSKQPEFYPQVKLMRWGNEVNMSFRLLDGEAGAQSVSKAADAISWSRGKMSARFYALPDSDDCPEGGYEFEITLDRKPPTNQITFSLVQKGLRFDYQPPLTADGLALALCDQITETEGFRAGKRIIYRPPNVVGSYAVYYDACPVNREGGKLYRTGKAFHIYRPKLVDAKGNTAWGTLQIDSAAGTMTVSVDQAWLNAATYPVTHAAGATFGNTTQQSTSLYVDGTPNAGFFTAPEAGTISSISTCVSLAEGANPGNVNVGFNSGTSTSVGTHVAHGTSTSISPGSKGFQTVNVSGAISASTAYWLQFKQEHVVAGYNNFYDSSSGNNVAYQGNEAYGTWGNSPGFTYAANYILSIYATYTASGGTAIKTFDGLAKASVKTVDGLAIASVKTVQGL